jgi:hypothetical protein
MAEPTPDTADGDEPVAVHPFDARVAEANLFGWVRPVWELLQRHAPILAAAGLVSLAVQWLLPFVAVSSPLFETRVWPRVVDFLVALAVNSGVFASAYAVLAQREGRPYRLGAIEPWGGMFVRAFGLAVLWTLTGVAIALAFGLAGVVIVKAFGGEQLIGAGIAGFALLGLAVVIGAALVLILFAPLWAGLAIRYSLSFVRIVRTNEGPVTAFRLAWQRVSEETWRYFWPAYVLVAATVSWALLTYKLPAIDPGGWVSRVLAVIAFAVGIAFAFVIERVYDTSLGFDPDAPLAVATLAPRSPASPAPTARTATATNRPATSQPLAQAGAPSATNRQDSGASPVSPPVPPAEFAALIAQHNYSPRELRGLLGRCSDKPASFAAIRAQILPLAQGPRIATAVILVEEALTADPRFFADEPDVVTPLAKRIASGGRPDLAVKLLQPFVREQRQHKLHLTASLFAAHLVAQNLKKPDAAKQFLLQLKQMYPQEPLIDQQLKRLAS